MAKITTILGSPRRRGNTAAILGRFEELAAAAGYEMDRINITDYNLKGCIGCSKCREVMDRPACILRDDMLSLFERMISSDLIVYASPLYVYSFTSQIKTLLDRQCCLVKFPEQGEPLSLLKGKRAALLVTCISGIEGNADLIPQIFQRECDFTQMEAIGKFIVPGCLSPKTLGSLPQETAQNMMEAIKQNLPV